MADAGADFYFNPWDPDFRANPYPHYKPLFSGAPRRLEMFMPMALVARYADASAVLRDHASFSSIQPPMPAEMTEGDPFAGATTMLFTDPPAHSRLRRLVSRAFTPKRIKELEPGIREITKQLLDAAAAKGQLEVMADLANALPVMVIAQMLGIPHEKYGTFKHWSDIIVAADNTLPGSPQPPEVPQTRRALADYFNEEIAKRRKDPGPDLVSALVAARDEAEALSEAELLNFVVLLLLAGNETTTNLIGNGMLALGRNPDQLARLRSKPELLPGAIEEMLRYDGPVQSTVRYTKAGTELGGAMIPAGTMIFVIVAAANRDPAQFPDPDRFDITRQPNEHLAFGQGIHFCIGAPLARLEGSIAIGSALERFPALRLADPDAPLTYKGSYFLRGLSSLPMLLS